MGNQFKSTDHAGACFGRLTVLEKAEKQGHERLWLCRCSCGVVKKISASSLVSGRTQSCGCLNAEVVSKRSKTHGLRQHRAYPVWNVMIQRCHNPKNKQFLDYGGRGIFVCSRWRKSFAAFIVDMGLPEPGMTLERKNNSRGYSKGNCVWATYKVQSRNKRNNRLVRFAGRSQLLVDWARELDFKFPTLVSRLYSYGWSVKRAFTTPVIARKPVRRSEV